MRTSVRAIADRLAADGNEYWAARLGDPGLFGGFQVAPVIVDGVVAYTSSMYGGARVTGDPRQIKWSQVAFVRHKSRKKRRA